MYHTTMSQCSTVAELSVTRGLIKSPRIKKYFFFMYKFLNPVDIIETFSVIAKVAQELLSIAGLNTNYSILAFFCIPY